MKSINSFDHGVLYSKLPEINTNVSVYKRLAEAESHTALSAESQSSQKTILDYENIACLEEFFCRSDNHKINRITVHRTFIEPLHKVNKVKIEKSKKQNSYVSKTGHKTDSPPSI